MSTHEHQPGASAPSFDRFDPTSIGYHDRSVWTDDCACLAPLLIIASGFFGWFNHEFTVRKFFGLITSQQAELVSPFGLLSRIDHFGSIWTWALAVGLYVFIALISVYPALLYRAPMEAEDLKPFEDTTELFFSPGSVVRFANIVIVLAVCGMSLTYASIGFWMFIGGNLLWSIAMRNVLAAGRRRARALPHDPKLALPAPS